MWSDRKFKIIWMIIKCLIKQQRNRVASSDRHFRMLLRAVYLLTYFYQWWIVVFKWCNVENVLVWFLFSLVSFQLVKAIKYSFFVFVFNGKSLSLWLLCYITYNQTVMLPFSLFCINLFKLFMQLKMVQKRRFDDDDDEIFEVSSKLPRQLEDNNQLVSFSESVFPGNASQVPQTLGEAFSLC